MNQQLSKEQQKVSDFIFKSPQIVAAVLEKNNISVKKPLTLDTITAATFKALYSGNVKFESDLGLAIQHEGYSNFVMLAVSAALSIASSFAGADVAKKALELQRNIALANLSQTRLLEEEKIRSGAETERTKILLQTLQQYQSDLQTQSTARIKNVWIYVGMLGTSIAVIYGTSILLTEK